MYIFRIPCIDKIDKSFNEDCFFFAFLESFIILVADTIEIEKKGLLRLMVHYEVK